MAWSDQHRAFLVCRHADVTAGLANPVFSSAITPRSLEDAPGAVVDAHMAVLRRQLDLSDLLHASNAWRRRKPHCGSWTPHETGPGLGTGL